MRERTFSGITVPAGVICVTGAKSIGWSKASPASTSSERYSAQTSLRFMVVYAMFTAPLPRNVKATPFPPQAFTNWPISRSIGKRFSRSSIPSRCPFETLPSLHQKRKTPLSAANKGNPAPRIMDIIKTYHPLRLVMPFFSKNVRPDGRSRSADRRQSGFQR